MTVLRTFPVRIPYTIFGNGAVNEVGKITKDLGAKKALVVTDKIVGKSDLLEKVKKPLQDAGIDVTVFSEVEPVVFKVALYAV